MAFLAHPRPATRVSAANVLPPAETPKAGALTALTALTPPRPVGHLWNYGLNTWGWEDTYGGGDHDYNDLIVGIDFTSTAGHGWLT